MMRIKEANRFTSNYFVCLKIKHANNKIQLKEFFMSCEELLYKLECLKSDGIELDKVRFFIPLNGEYTEIKDFELQDIKPDSYMILTY